jgi:Arc/MetJ-type ribon-helix-helix transcriptional regulator
MTAAEKIRLRHQPMRGVNVKLTDEQRAFLDENVAERDRSEYIRRALSEQITRDRESRGRKRGNGGKAK